MKNKIFIPLILGAIFLAASFIFHSAKKNHGAIPHHARNCSNEIARLSAESKQMLDRLMVDTNFFSAPYSSNAIAPIMQLRDKGIDFLAYRGDSLIYWSSNSVAHSWNSPNDLSDTSMVWSGNGWHYTRIVHQGDYTLLALILIRTEYPFNNQYLRNHFNPVFGLPPNTSLNFENGPMEVSSPGGTFLFSLAESEQEGPEPDTASILFLASYFLFLLFLANAHSKLNPFPKYPIVAVVAFAIDALILRFLVHFFEFPDFLSHSQLFQRSWYSAGPWFESLGDLSLNAFTVIVITAQFALFSLRNPAGQKDVNRSFIHSFAASLISFFALWGTWEVAEGIYLHSNIPINFTSLFSFKPYSYLALVLGGVFYTSTFLLIASMMHRYVINSKPRHMPVWTTLLSALIFVAFTTIIGDQALECTIFGIILILFLWYSQFGLKGPLSLTSAGISILLFSMLATYQHNRLNDQKEKQQRVVLAGTLSKEQDPVAEYLYKEALARMQGDTTLFSLINTDTLDEDLFSRYLLYHYFSQDPHWKRYNFQVTLCTPTQELIVKSQGSYDLTSINCDAFFNDLARERGKMTLTKNLIFIDYGTRQDSYLGMISFERNGRPSLNVYVEFVSRMVRSDLGFPALLTDQQESLNLPGYSYSYAFYDQGSLSTSYGKFIYNIDLDNYPAIARKMQFFDEKDFHHMYNHLFYRIDDNRVMLLSRESQDFLALLSPISYFFLLFVLLALLVSVIFWDVRNIVLKSPSFRTRMQFTFIGVIFSSFIIVGWASLGYLKQLNQQKNYDVLSEKAHSVLIEVEHKLLNVDSLNPEIWPYLTQMLTKFSNVFFSDINLFDISGHLIATSRKQLFDEQLISSRMDPEAFRMMSQERRSLFIHRESIGELEYLSAYIPFRNKSDELVAYLNLPYFVKEQELKGQIGTFLVTFINVYALLIALSILIAVFLASLITRPLRLIRDKLRQLSLGGINEAIQITRKDEIGELVMEYNRMVAQLEESALRLAASERQSAWREMAKQVAHEIKNPLTPMKLSVQYLEKAWDDKDPQWEQRLKRFTQTIIEQIENLAQIATEFSDFAKMPETKKETVALEKVVANSCELFTDGNNSEIKLHLQEGRTYPVEADPKQLLRAFNNLIKNARQALEDVRKGRIDIRMGEEGRFWTVEIEDNGPGIPVSEADKIFRPNFTTKSSGMGLGLAIVRSIVEEIGGDVSFRSAPGVSTVFKVRLPKSKD